MSKSERLLVEQSEGKTMSKSKDYSLSKARERQRVNRAIQRKTYEDHKKS